MKYLSQLHTLWQNFDYTSPRVIHSFKTAIACTLGYLLVLFSPLPQAQWIVITVIVVMAAQTSLGSVVIKSTMRFWGTVLGTVFSALVFLLLGTNPLGTAIALFILVLIFAYIAASPGDISYAGTLGAVTVAIILLNNVVNLSIAFDRFLEIVIGIVLSLLVSKFLFPIHSHQLLLKSFAHAINNLQQHFIRSLTMNPAHLAAQANELDARIVNNFATQRRLIREIQFEFKIKQPQKKILSDILQAEIKLYRANSLMFTSSHMSQQNVMTLEELPALQQFREEISAYLQYLSEKLRARKPLTLTPPSTNLSQLVFDFKNQLPTSQENQDYITVFLFGANMLVDEIKLLLSAIDEIVKIGNS